MNTVNVQKHLSILGLPVKDRVTGFSGIVENVGFDLYGCIQCIVKPPINEKGEVVDGRWFDISRLEIRNKKPVMKPPNFEYGPVAEGKHGCAEKPII